MEREIRIILCARAALRLKQDVRFRQRQTSKPSVLLLPASLGLRLEKEMWVKMRTVAQMIFSVM